MTYIRYKLVLLYSSEEQNFNLETEDKISQAVPNFLKHYCFRSSHLKCTVKKGVLRNFVKFTEKHLCKRFFFNKVAGLVWPATLLKESLWYQCFRMNFAKFLRTPFLYTNSGRLFLLFPHADGNSKFT